MTDNKKKFWVTYEADGQKHAGPFTTDTTEAVEKKIQELNPNFKNIYARSMSSVLYERICYLRDKVKIDVGPNAEEKWATIKKYEIEQRLRCCADAALMFGDDSLESLERILSRMVDCDWSIVGLDGHMFSFGFKSPAGFHGGIIFHCSDKTWSSHT